MDYAFETMTSYLLGLGFINTVCVSQNSCHEDIRQREALQGSRHAGSKSERKTKTESSAHKTVMGPSSAHQDHMFSRCMRVSRKHLETLHFLPLLSHFGAKPAGSRPSGIMGWVSNRPSCEDRGPGPEGGHLLQLLSRRVVLQCFWVLASGLRGSWDVRFAPLFLERCDNWEKWDRQVLWRVCLWVLSRSESVVQHHFIPVPGERALTTW